MDANEKDSGRWSDMWYLLLTFPELFQLVVAYLFSVPYQDLLSKTTHVHGYYGAWPGWAVSVSVLPLTTVLPETSNSRYFMRIGVEVSFFL